MAPRDLASMRAEGLARIPLMWPWTLGLQAAEMHVRQGLAGYAVVSVPPANRRRISCPPPPTPIGRSPPQPPTPHAVLMVPSKQHTLPHLSVPRRFRHPACTIGAATVSVTRTPLPAPLLGARPLARCCLGRSGAHHKGARKMRLIKTGRTSNDRHHASHRLRMCRPANPKTQRCRGDAARARDAMHSEYKTARNAQFCDAVAFALVARL